VIQPQVPTATLLRLHPPREAHLRSL